MIVANEVASLYPTAICIRILDVDEGGMYKIEKPVTINELIHNEWINPLYWGDLFIDTNGNVLCNEKQIIGNILKWDEIKFHKLIEKGSHYGEPHVNNFIIAANVYSEIYVLHCPELNFITKKHTVK